MSFIRRILSHSFLIFLIVGAALAWYYRADIFPNADKKAGQDVAQKEDEGIVTVKSSDALVEQKKTSPPSDTNEKPVAQGQTVFGGNPQVNPASTQAPQVDMSKYRPLTPPEQTKTESENVETEGATPTTAGETTSAESTIAVAPQPMKGAAADIATATGITAAGGAASRVPAQQVADNQVAQADAPAAEPVNQAAEAETPPAVPDTQVAQAETSPAAPDTQVAEAETPPAESDSQASQTETSPAAPDTQVAQAVTSPAEQVPASAEYSQQSGQPATQPARMQESMGYPAGYLPLPPPAIPEPEPLSQEEKKLLSGARQAFWQRDTEKAEKDYQSLIALKSGSPDPYGELGNVYYSTGQWDKAAEMYNEAGVRLIERKQFREAMHLVSVLRGLDAERARTLEKALNDALPRQGQASAVPEQ